MISINLSILPILCLTTYTLLYTLPFFLHIPCFQLFYIGTSTCYAMMVFCFGAWWESWRNRAPFFSVSQSNVEQSTTQFPAVLQSPRMNRKRLVTFECRGWDGTACMGLILWLVTNRYRWWWKLLFSRRCVKEWH